MTEVWNNNEPSGYILEVRAKGTVTTRTFAGPITPGNIEAVTRELNVSNYTVYDATDIAIPRASFPYSGKVVVKEYNAAKWSAPTLVDPL